MSSSVFLLGCDPGRAHAQRALIGGPARRFFALAQRCVWGLSQADLVRVDVAATLRALRRLYPAQFVTHLLEALAVRARAPEQAEHSLARARELISAEHPWYYLLPSHDEWTPTPPRQALKEVVPGRVWRVGAELPFANTPFSISSTSTLIRTERGGLVLVNPVPLTPRVLEQVRALGALQVLAIQGRAHSRFAAFARGQFPEARLLLSAGHRAHPTSAHLGCDGLLDGPDAALDDEFAQLPVDGTDADEVVLLHRPTRLLIFQDLVANNLACHRERPFAGRLEYFVFGLIDRVGLLSYHPMLWRDLPRLQHSLSAILASDYQQITGAHWPLAPCDGVIRESFDRTLAQTVALSRWQHLRLVAEYFALQPGFLRDLLRYRSHSSGS